MHDLNDILFLPLDLPTIRVDYDKLLTVYNSLKGELLSDEYRGCEHIPIRWLDTRAIGKKELIWTTVAEQYFPEVKEYFIKHVQPWVGSLPRMMIIVTPPNTNGLDHIDCDPSDFDQCQLKFRVVLQGMTSTLYFLNEKDEREYALECNDKPFLMCGKWPHGLDNFTNQYKFTLAIGAPWKCEPIPELMDLVTKSKNKYGWTDKSQIKLMPDYEKYFKINAMGKEKLDAVTAAEKIIFDKNDE